MFSRKQGNQDHHSSKTIGDIWSFKGKIGFWDSLISHCEFGCLLIKGTLSLISKSCQLVLIQGNVLAFILLINMQWMKTSQMTSIPKSHLDKILIQDVKCVLLFLFHSLLWDIVSHYSPGWPSIDYVVQLTWSSWQFSCLILSSDVSLCAQMGQWLFNSTEYKESSLQQYQIPHCNVRSRIYWV